MQYPMFAESDGFRVEGTAHVEELRPLKGARRWFVTWQFEVLDAWFTSLSYGVLSAMVTAANPTDAMNEAYTKEFKTDICALTMSL